MARLLCSMVLLSLVVAGCGDDDSTRPQAKACPSGTVKWANGHCYEAILSPGFSWYDAKAACEQRGGHLVTITSEWENAFVFSLVKDNNAFWYLDMYGNGLGPWLGGYQEEGAQEPDGGWRWVTGEPWNYENWGPNQPDNAIIINQDGLRFFKTGGLIGAEWDDAERYNPVDHRKGFICEYEP